MTDQDARALAERFVAAWNDHDLDGAIALCTDDVVFESTDPAPDGTRYAGRPAVRGAWQADLADPAAKLELEQVLAMGERVVLLWRQDRSAGRVRGADVLTLRDGLVAQRLSYLKG